MKATSVLSKTSITKITMLMLIATTLSFNSHANKAPENSKVAPDPVVKIHPKYPIEAARNGTEGFCTVSFDINTIGGVKNAKVIECQPGDVFAKEALRAVVKWKYIPKIVDGVATPQNNLITVINFNMN